MLITFVPNPAGSIRIGYDLSVVILLYPVLVIIGSKVEPAGLQRRCYKWLGSISYPLYLLHMPVTYITAGVWAHVFHAAPEFFRPYSGLFLLSLQSCALPR